MIRYRVTISGTTSPECPYKQKFSTEIIHVGSVACGNCEHNIHIDEIDKRVYCRLDEETKPLPTVEALSSILAGLMIDLKYNVQLPQHLCDNIEKRIKYYAMHFTLEQLKNIRISEI